MKTIANNDHLTTATGQKYPRSSRQPRWRRRFAALGLAVALGSLPALAQSGAASPAATASAAAPAYPERAPFSAQEFWQKLLPLLDEENGYRMKLRFEETFGMQFPPPRHAHEDPAYRGFWAYVGKDWYLGVGVDVFGVDPLIRSKMRLSIGWTFKTFGNAGQGECVALETVRNDLFARGWTKGSSDRKYARFDKFVRGNKGDLIVVDGGEPCITGLGLSVGRD